MKFVRGPHYAELQWDLDRLYVMGKVEMRDFEPFHDEDGWWFRANYVLAPETFEQIAWIRRSPRLARIHDFQIELAFAFATLPEEVQNTTSERDATYADRLVGDRTLIDFAWWSKPGRNYSEEVTRSMTRFAPEGVRLLPRDRIHLYFRYLSRVDPVRPARMAAGGGRAQ